MGAAVRRPSRRARWLLLLGILSMMALGIPPVAASATTMPTPWFGVLQPDASRAGTVHAPGVTVATLEIGWDHYEPSQGTFSASYRDEVRQRYQTLVQAGYRVILDPGLQYPPDWVFGVDGATRFVNQYGDVFHGDMGADVPNAVFNEHVQAAQAAYIARLGRDLADLDLYGVRASGLTYAEMRYPLPYYNGHTNSFWAFDAHALAASPVPNWRPGDGGGAKAAAFLDFYLGSLADYGTWLLTTYRDAFPAAAITVQLGSWGIRPGEVQAAADAGLDGSSRGEQRQTIQQGLDWARQFPAFASVGNVIVSSTWLDAPDQGDDPIYETPAAYITRLATPLGMPVIGENTGGGDLADMQLCVERVRELGMAGMLWMTESDLFAGGGKATIDDYAGLIGATPTATPSPETSPSPAAATSPGPSPSPTADADPGTPARGAARPTDRNPLRPRSVDRACPAANETTFTDTGSSVHREAIDCAASLGIVTGTDDARFSPGDTVTRASMASMLARLVVASGGTLPDAPPDAFVDDDGSVHEPAINQLAAVGVVHGVTADRFAPGAAVNRAQMASLLVRALEYRLGGPLPGAGSDWFVDDDGSSHERDIDRLASAGITAGRSEDEFDPAGEMRRDGMASFLIRTIGLLVDEGITSLGH